MSEEEARVRLLEIIQERLEAHRRVDERDVDEGETLQLKKEDFEQFGTELGWNAREASALYKRLVLGGYIRQAKGERTFLDDVGGVIGIAWVEDLTDRGMKAIGVLRDPTEALIEALTAAREDIVESKDIPEDKKPDVLRPLDGLLKVIQVVEGAGRIISQYLPPSPPGT